MDADATCGFVTSVCRRDVAMGARNEVYDAGMEMPSAVQGAGVRSAQLSHTAGEEGAGAPTHA